MDQRSSQREARTERHSRTPYARPTPNRNDRATTPKSPFAALKSIINFVSPWRSGPSPGLPTHNGHNTDQRSEDGSEDNWEGEGPEEMRGRDMFTLAAAGGREGAEFETRQAEWRARGELAGGRRDMARRDLHAGPSTLFTGAPKSVISTPATPLFPGGFPKQITSSQTAQPDVTSLGGMAGSVPPPPKSAPRSEPRTSLVPNLFGKQARTPNAHAGPSNPGNPSFASISTPNPRPVSPIPFFTPPARSTSKPGDSSPSQCQLALSTFLQERAGQDLTTEDLTIIETLTARIKGSQAEAQLRGSGRGGWLPSPGSGTVVGSVGAAGGSAGAGVGTPYKQKYLGPGMSPRKMADSSSSTRSSLNRSTTETPPPAGPDASDLPPSFPNRHLVNTILRYSATSSPLRQSHSAPAVSSAAGPSGTPSKRKQDAAPESESATKRREIEAAGKQNAAAIMMSLLEEAEPDVPRHVEPVRWNSYDMQPLHANNLQLKASSSGGPTTQATRGAPPIPNTVPSTSHAGSTPSKQRTPTRGAAAKLEAHKEAMKGAKPLTTVDRIKGVRPWEARSTTSTPQPKVKAPVGDDVATDGQDESEEVDELDNEYDTDAADISEVEDASRGRRRRANAPASPPAPQAAPEPEPEVPRIPQGTIFQPYRTPQLSVSQAPAPAPAPATQERETETYESATRDAIIAAPKKAEEEARANKFEFSPQIQKGWGQKPKPVEEKLEERVSLPALGRSASTVASTLGGTGAVEGGYLSAKEAAKKVDKLALPFYPFTPPVLEKKAVDERTERAKDAARKRTEERGEEKFVFTLELAPAPAPVARTPAVNMFGGFTGFGNAGKSVAPAASAGGQWECDTCMLKNPDSAKDKCQICEAPRPAPKAAVPSKAVGQWECDTCMLKNPDSAKDKCQICEAPRPAPKAAAPSKAVGQWECDTCMLKNPDSVKEKCQVCDAARPAHTLSSSVPAPAPVPSFTAAVPPPGPAPTPFTGFGVGFGPKKGGEADWTCGTCMLSNPGSATEKCTVCDTPKP